MSGRRPTGVVVAVRPDGIPPPHLLDKAGGLAEFRFVRNEDGLGRDPSDAEVVFVWNFRSRLVPEALQRLPNLRWVHVAATGVDASLSAEVISGPIIVTNSRGVTANAMAEYALGLMLIFAKDMPRTLDDQRQAAWQPRMTETLSGKSALLIGVGPVNRVLARALHALGMRVTGVGRTGHVAAEGFVEIVSFAELAQVLPNADYVVIATPLTPDTDGLIGRDAFATMKRGARLINVGRGRVVDELSLMEALRNGRLAGAGLDVFWREPLEPEHPLWKMPNVLISPHMCGDFRGWEDAMVDLFLSNLERWIRGDVLQNVVDKHLGYVPSEGALV